MLSPDPIEHTQWRNDQLHVADYESRRDEEEPERYRTRCRMCMRWVPVLRGTHVCVDCDKEI